MAEVSQSVQRAPRSGIRKIMELSQTMEGVLHLEVGEPLFQTPAHIVEAGCEALRQGFTKYTPNAGMQQLRETIAAVKSEQLKLAIRPENVIVGIGGVEVINNAFRAVCEPGDEILIPDPAWPNYVMMATIANARIVPYRLCPENQFFPDIDELERLVTERTRMIVVNSPSNPLGVIFPRTVMEALVEFANRHDLFLLSDEAYEKIVYQGEMVSPLTMDTQHRVIAAHTFSKTYAMTGWRVGYVIADLPMIQAMTKLQEAYVSSVPAATQIAAIAALKGPQDCIEEMSAAYQRNRDKVAEMLSAAGITYFNPSGAFYMWVSIDGRNSTEFAQRLVQAEKVALAPGSTFGATGEGWIRISLASPTEDLVEGVQRMIKFMNSR